MSIRLRRSGRPIVPALATAALLGTASVTALAQAVVPAFASAPVEGGYVDLVARVTPAVVTIDVAKTTASADQGSLQQGSAASASTCRTA